MIIHASSASYSPAECKVIEWVNSPVPIVLVTRRDDFVFNEELLNLNQYILFDFSEYGWDRELTQTHVFGRNTEMFKDLFDSPEWEKFDNWAKENPPTRYFKRELLSKDASHWLIPCTYPCYHNIPEHQSLEQYNAREIELLFYWGRSSEYRVKFHSNAYIEEGITLVDNIYYLQGYLNEGNHKHIWCSFPIPHFARIDIYKLLGINELSKLSLSMKGSGFSCFRDSEAPTNSVMVIQDSGIAYPFPWIHGVNCIMYKGNDPIPAIKEALKRDDLYDIYLKGVENAKNYQIDNYTRHVEKLINEI